LDVTTTPLRAEDEAMSGLEYRNDAHADRHAINTGRSLLVDVEQTTMQQQ